MLRFDTIVDKPKTIHTHKCDFFHDDVFQNQFMQILLLSLLAFLVQNQVIWWWFSSSGSQISDGFRS